MGIGAELNGGQRMSPDDSEDPLSKISQQLLDGFPENWVLTVTSPASRFVTTSVILFPLFSQRHHQVKILNVSNKPYSHGTCITIRPLVIWNDCGGCL